MSGIFASNELAQVLRSILRPVADNGVADFLPPAGTVCLVMRQRRIRAKVSNRASYEGRALTRGVMR